MWIVIGLGLIFLALGTVIAIQLSARRSGDTGGPEMSGDDMFTLGIIFTGAGAALSATIGPFMLFMVALGLVYMTLGMRRKRQH